MDPPPLQRKARPASPLARRRPSPPRDPVHIDPTSLSRLPKLRQVARGGFLLLATSQAPTRQPAAARRPSSPRRCPLVDEEQSRGSDPRETPLSSVNPLSSSACVILRGGTASPRASAVARAASYGRFARTGPADSVS